MGLGKQHSRVVTVSIGTLELDGFCSPAHRHRIVSGLQQELARLMSAAELPEQIRQRQQGRIANTPLGQLDGGQIRPSGLPEQVGAQIAAAIYRSMS